MVVGEGNQTTGGSENANAQPPEQKLTAEDISVSHNERTSEQIMNDRKDAGDQFQQITENAFGETMSEKLKSLGKDPDLGDSTSTEPGTGANPGQEAVVAGTPDVESKPTSDVISKLESEKQQSEQKTKEAWKKVMNTLPDGFVTSESDGGKKIEILIETMENSHYGITEDGIVEAPATTETQTELCDQFLNSEKDNNFSKLHLPFVLSKQSPDRIIEIINKSLKTATEAKKIKGDVGQLEKSYDFANKLIDSLNARQPPSAPKV
jgi:hypothetical protein